MHSEAEPYTRALALLVPFTQPEPQARTVRGSLAPSWGSEGHATKPRPSLNQPLRAQVQACKTAAIFAGSSLIR